MAAAPALRSLFIQASAARESNGFESGVCVKSVELKSEERRAWRIFTLVVFVGLEGRTIQMLIKI